jgi:hypothetical protein
MLYVTLPVTGLDNNVLLKQSSMACAYQPVLAAAHASSEARQAMTMLDCGSHQHPSSWEECRKWPLQRVQCIHNSTRSIQSTTSSASAGNAAVLCLQGEYSVGVITQAVEQVAAQGVAYFGAAGNYDGAVWEATPAKWITFGNRTLHNFGTAAAPSTFLEVHLFGPTRFYLHVRGWGDLALLLLMMT